MHDDAFDLLAGLVLDDGRRWGEAAEGFQVADARAVLDVGGPRQHYLTRPRGGSKTTDGAGVGLAALLTQLPDRGRAYAFAADRDQAGLLVDALAGFVERTPEVRGAVQVDTSKAAATRSGATLTVMASDASSSWGLRPHLVFADELGRWKQTREPRALWRSIFSALPKVTGSRLVVLTSAADPAHWAYAVLERARSSPRWRVSEAPGPLPWVDPGDLAEQAAELPEWEYERLHLNRWVAAEDRLVDPAALRECVTLDGSQAPRPGVRYVVGVDVGLKNDRTAVAVCHGEPVRSDDGGRRMRVVLDRLWVAEGTRERPVQLRDVEAAIVQVCGDYGRPKVRLDPWQAVGLAQRLRGRGVSVEEWSFTSQSVGRLASTLHVLLRDRMLALPDDEALIDELAHVRLRETSPGVVRMDHDSGRHDDRAIALALAALELVGEGWVRPGRGSSPAGLRLGRSRGGADGTPGRSDGDDGSGRPGRAGVFAPAGGPGAGEATRRRLRRLPKIAGRK